MKSAITMKIITASIIIYCYSVCMIHCQNTNKNEELELIINGLKYWNSIIIDGIGELKYSMVLTDSLDKEYYKYTITNSKGKYETRIGTIPQNYENSNVIFAFKGKKMRCEEEYFLIGSYNGNEKSFKGKKIIVFNGEKTDILDFDPIGENGLLIPYAIEKNGNGIPSKYNPRKYMFNIMTIPIIDLLGGIKELPFSKFERDVEILGIEIIEGIKCKHIKINMNDKNNSGYIDIWLADHSIPYLIKAEIKDNNSLLLIDCKYVYYGNDLWFLHKYTSIL